MSTQQPTPYGTMVVRARAPGAEARALIFASLMPSNTKLLLRLGNLTSGTLICEILGIGYVACMWRQKLAFLTFTLLMLLAAALATTCSRSSSTWASSVSALATISGSDPYSSTGYAEGIARGTDFGCAICPLTLAYIRFMSEFDPHPWEHWGSMCPYLRGSWSYSPGTAGSWIEASSGTICSNNGVEVIAYLAGYCGT